MRLPRLESPQDYVGLYVYDFGDHASVGYTAEEVSVLKGRRDYADGQVYLIHNVDSHGNMALRGVSAGDMFAEEAMIFAHDEPLSARASYERLREGAVRCPLRCQARMELALFEGHDPPHVVALICRAHAGHAVGAWLLQTGFDGGDVVTGGTGDLAAYRAGNPTPLADCRLACHERYLPRTEAEVLDGVHAPVQR